MKLAVFALACAVTCWVEWATWGSGRLLFYAILASILSVFATGIVLREWRDGQ